MVRGGELADINVVFTGLYRDGIRHGDMSIDNKIATIRDSGVEKIYWYTWVEQPDYNSFLLQKHILQSKGVIVREINEPFPHTPSSIQGRQRQIYNIEESLKDFGDDEIVVKLRWDLDFSKDLFCNLQTPEYLSPIEDGLTEHKIWTAFYSIQELFSPSDQAFAGYKKDLEKVINFNFSIEGVSSNNYISHDGMMLMPKLISCNKEVCHLVRAESPDPWKLMFDEAHVTDDEYLNAWAYNYYILDKYFKTGPLGTSYFKKGDSYRWPHSFVDYERFKYNYDTVTGAEPKLGICPRYRVYDDIFIQRLAIIRTLLHSPYVRLLMKIQKVGIYEKFTYRNVWWHHFRYQCNINRNCQESPTICQDRQDICRIPRFIGSY